VKAKPYIIVVDLPACSAVLYVRGDEVTILKEDTAAYCEAFATGYAWGAGLKPVELWETVDLPAGNPADSYEKYLAAKEVSR
jgi:hypothetical protein